MPDPREDSHEFVHEAITDDTQRWAGRRCGRIVTVNFAAGLFGVSSTEILESGEFSRDVKYCDGLAEIQMPLGRTGFELWLDWTDHHFLAIPEFLRRLIR